MGILIKLSLPSFTQMLLNYQIRNAAESIVNGIQRARGEAVTRNANVQFVLGSGTSWTVDYVTKPNASDPVLDTRSSSEGSQNVTTTITPSGATNVTFNNLGLVVSSPTTLTQVDFTATGAGQNRRVLIGAGGSARSCDPALLAFPANVRGC